MIVACLHGFQVVFLNLKGVWSMTFALKFVNLDFLSNDEK